jgi:hypothetical protein
MKTHLGCATAIMPQDALLTSPLQTRDGVRPLAARSGVR